MNENGDEANAGITSTNQDPDLQKPGLNLELWVKKASNRWRRALLVWAIAFSPVKAFGRRCGVERVLATSPMRVFFWILGWYLVLLVVSVGIRFGLDKLQGVRLVIGGYWNHPDAFRFGSLRLLPMHICLAWVQCLLVSLIGMVIAFRGLTVRQVARLATWLFAFTLVAGLFDVLYVLLWHETLAALVLRLPDELALRMHEAGYEIAYRAHDIVLGLLGGVAVGTVLQRRRRVVAVVSAAVLAILFPIYTNVQLAYLRSVYEPLRRFVVAEPELSVWIALLPEGLKIPGYEQNIQYASSRSAEEAQSRGGLPTSVVSYVIEPMPDATALLNAVRAHLGSLGWIPLRYDPLNVHHKMPTGDGAGWVTSDPGVTGPSSDGRQWGGWWVQNGEAIDVHIWHGTPPETTHKAVSCSMGHYNKEVAAPLLQPYRQVYGELPGEAPANDRRRTGQSEPEG